VPIVEYPRKKLNRHKGNTYIKSMLNILEKMTFPIVFQLADPAIVVNGFFL
jgi:hypothetical protein